MKVAIIGLPQTGKTTLFEGLAVEIHPNKGNENIAEVKIFDQNI